VRNETRAGIVVRVGSCTPFSTLVGWGVGCSWVGIAQVHFGFLELWQVRGCETSLGVVSGDGVMKAGGDERMAL